jgi:hypothetical protein
VSIGHQGSRKDHSAYLPDHDKLATRYDLRTSLGGVSAAGDDAPLLNVLLEQVNSAAAPGVE